MDTIKSLIYKIYKKKDCWVYTNNRDYPDIYDKSQSHKFIKAYLGHAQTEPESGSLAAVLNESNFNRIEEWRYQHIVFTFFLGIVIYKNCDDIRDAIDKQFCKNKKYVKALEKHGDAPFAYLWFLICLFHDLGYQFENEKEGDQREFANYQGLKKQAKLFESPTDISEYEGVPSYFTEEVIENYYKYRIEVMSKCDHGISGGVYLFHDLCKIRRNKKKDNPQAFEKGWWKDELEDVFKLASSVVLCHNIFLPDEKNMKDYRDYGLDELVKISDKVHNGEYPFKMEDYPIFFLFCLVDSIEPIKVVKNISLLDKIYWDIEKDSITISTTLTCGCVERVLCNANGLKTWLCRTQKVSDKVKILF